MEAVLYLVIGLTAGALVVGLITWLNRRSMKDTFTAISRDALKWQQDMGGAELDEKKKLIDSTLDMMKAELNKVEKLLAESAERIGFKIAASPMDPVMYSLKRSGLPRACCS